MHLTGQDPCPGNELVVCRILPRVGRRLQRLLTEQSVAAGVCMPATSVSALFPPCRNDRCARKQRQQARGLSATAAVQRSATAMRRNMPAVRGDRSRATMSRSTVSSEGLRTPFSSMATNGPDTPAACAISPRVQPPRDRHELNNSPNVPGDSEAMRLTLRRSHPASKDPGERHHRPGRATFNI